MTNLCAELAIYSLVVTQWTGFTLNNKEAGVVVTNHEARVSFEGKTNAIPLKTELSGFAVWRQERFLTVTFTNSPMEWKWQGHTNYLTNYVEWKAVPMPPVGRSPYTLELR